MKTAPFLLSLFLHFVGRTNRWKIEGEQKLRELHGKPCILAGWHGRMFLGVYFLRNRGFYGIVSPSTDGEYFARIFTLFGWKLVRGSSRRRALSALLEGRKILQDGHVLAVTPDGPMGPVSEVHPGVVYLSSRCRCPIVPVGISSSRFITLKTWDKAMLPLPFSRAALYFGDHFQVPEEMRKEKVSIFCEKLKQEIVFANAQADLMVQS